MALLAGCLALSVSVLSLPASSNVRKSAGRAHASANRNVGVTLSTPEPQTPIEHNNRGVELGSKGLWPQAIHEHELALIADPNNKEFRTNLSAAQLRYGDVLASRRDYYNAMKQYRGALYVDSNNSVADENLDTCLTKTGKNPDDLHTRQLIGENADVSGDYETAIVEYRKCVKMADDGPTHAQLGRVLLKAGKTYDGYQELKIAVAKSWDKKDYNDLSTTHRQLGDVLKQQAYVARGDNRPQVGMKRLLNAGIEYRRAVTFNPSNLDAVRSLIEVAQQAVAINPTFDNHLTLGGAYLLSGDFDHAKQEYEECWKLNPNNTALNAARRSYRLSVVQSHMTPPAVLATTAEKIAQSVAQRPNDAELLYMLGRAREAQGRKPEALEWYRKASAINQYVTPDLQAGIVRLTGAAQPASPLSTKSTVKGPLSGSGEAAAAANALVYADVEKRLRMNDLDGALKQLDVLLHKDPKDGHAWLLMGNAREKKGALDEAAAAYRQAAYMKDPEAASALRSIDYSRVQPALQSGDRAAQSGNWVAAAASYREAVSIGPNLAVVHAKLADALKHLGDDKEAERELKKKQELEK